MFLRLRFATPRQRSGSSRNYGSTEIELRFATPDYKTLASPDNRQRTTVGAAAGITESRNYGVTEIELRQTKDKSRKAKGRVAAGITELWIDGIMD